DKAKAYEQGAMEERQENRSRAMQQLGDLFDRETAAADRDSDFDLANPGGTEEAEKPAPKTIQSSAAAYRDLNATLGNFYEQPKNDNAEMDELLERIATLESELESGKERSSTMDEQVALMEKSYELAAKYMGNQNGTRAAAGQTAEPSPVQKAGKNTAKPVRQVTHQVVSSLGQPMSNAEFVASFSQERNRSFNTAVGVTTVSDRNTIPACVYGAQSVTDGQAVRLRLLEPMAVADRIIPRNAVVVGAAKIQGERLAIEITSLEHDGTVIPVELEVYDTDGQPGIFIPNSMEMNAVREVAANMGGSLGSSINISTNAGAQLASDLGKGLIQGTSQYIAKKMRTVKVHLKAGYRVMLYQEVN
ncbi:conjugative transposon protein TraM, partial [Phocaeicola vulgatus]